MGDNTTNTVHCATHGECDKTFVCGHLASNAAGLGFNRDEPSDEKKFPDAWCDDCEVIFKAYNGWDDESQKLTNIVMLCSACYELARVRNARTDVTLDDLANLRWKCHTCEEWHSGPCLDFSFDSPIYWSSEDELRNVAYESGSSAVPPTFLNSDLCVIERESFFVRGVIHLPIIGTSETLRWGVWGSLSKEHFDKLIGAWNDPRRAEMDPMFSWLSNDIAEYPSTLSLKLYAHIKEPPDRPIFEVEPTDHLLSQEYYHGITAERVKEIMSRQLRQTQ